jgi:HEAT repeat protein
VATLKDAVENDPEVGVKRKAVFALSQLPKDEAVPELLHVAQTNRDPAVRKDAIFWLGQAHDPRALAYFEQILEH